MYPIMHYPPTLDSTDRGIAVGWVLWGNPANGAWSLKIEDTVAGYAQETIKDGDNDANVSNDSTYISGCYPTRYAPPSAGAANLHQGNFKALEIENTNCYIASISIWHIEHDSELDDDLVPVTLGTVDADKIISQKANSLQGLYEIIGDGSDNVTSVERCLRRVFFNESHPTGILIAANTAMSSIVSGANYEWPAEARMFSQAEVERYCYPALVIETDGVDATHTCQIKYTTDCAANNTWTYTVQNAEPDNTPYIITPAMAGASSASGLRVESAIDDSVLIEAQTDAGVTLTIHSWALFEGPAW
jgi:hypothetical protein